MCTTANVAAQKKGFVWDPPASVQNALDDLRTIALTGATAVRTPLISDTSLFSLADSLAITFFQELGVEYLTATELLDETPTSATKLIDALKFGGKFASGRTFGLSYLADTSDPDACRYFETLGTIGREVSPESVLYYTSPYVSEDACSSTVDFRLASTIAANKFLKFGTEQSWPARLGFAGVGTYFDPASYSGLRSRHSEESQARFLENALTYIDRLGDAVPAVFIYRWRDEHEESSFETDLFARKFGVNGDSGSRESREVARGFFVGNQKVFAFDAGEEPQRPINWMVILAWIILSLLAVAYVLTPRVQSIMQRYFFAHGFYCSAVAEGRETTPLASASIILLIALSFSLVATTVVRHIAFSSGFDILAHRLPDFAAWVLLRTSVQSSLGVILISVLYFAIVLIQSAYLSIVGGAKGRIGPVQALQLQIWPRWHMIALMVLAVSAFSSSEGRITSYTGIVLAIMATTSMLWSTLRTVYDFRLASRQPVVRTFAAGLLSPSLLIAMGILFLLIREKGTVAYLWHLLALG